MIDRIIEKETLSRKEMEEILAAHPPAGDYPKIGPDTPAKILPSESEEDAAGLRSFKKNPEEKLKAALKYYNVDIDQDSILKLRDPVKWVKEPELVDFFGPQATKPKRMWSRALPEMQSWHFETMKALDKEKPGWRRSEVARVTKIGDESRSVKLREVIANFEERLDSGVELNSEEQRQLAASRAELQHYEEKWSGDGWMPSEDRMRESEFAEYLRFLDTETVLNELDFWRDFPPTHKKRLYRLGLRLKALTSTKPREEEKVKQEQ